MKKVEVDPDQFIGCGLSLEEWVQLTEKEKEAFVAARDRLLGRLADAVIEAVERREQEVLEEMMERVEP